MIQSPGCRMKAVITVDIGTTSLRAIVYDETRPCAARRTSATTRPATWTTGAWSRSPHSWQTQVRAVLRNAGQAVHDRGVAAGLHRGHRAALVADRGGRCRPPLQPAILWQDTRCAALAQAMAGHDAEVYRKTGLKISPVFSAIKMAWLRQNRPDSLGRHAQAAGRAGLGAVGPDRPLRHRPQPGQSHQPAEPAARGSGMPTCWRCSACRRRCCATWCHPVRWSAA